MAVLPTMHIEVDPQTSRLQGDRLAKLVDGYQWDLAETSSTCAVEFITRTAMLLPAPLSPNWRTSSTGQYVRLRKSDLSISASSDWKEFSRPPLNGNYYVQSLNVNTKVYTNTSYSKNKPMFLSWFAYNSGNEAFIQMECGWGEGTDDEVSLRFWSDGNVEVWKNSEQVGAGSIAAKTSDGYTNGLETRSNGTPGRVQSNEIVDVMLIPSRKRDLLVIANGGGFSFRFEDIDPLASDPTITGAGQFWFQVPTGQCTVSLAPLKFETSGNLISNVFEFREAPLTGEVPELTLYSDAPGYGTSAATLTLVEADGTTAFVPDGVEKQARLKVALTGDGDTTRWIYGASVAIPARISDTPDTPTNIDDFWMSAQFDVPENPSGVSLRVQCKEPDAMVTAGAAQIRSMTNRDIRLYFGDDATVFQGRVVTPSHDETPSDETEVVTLECRDLYVRLEKCLIQDPEPFDGMTLSDAIIKLLQIAGFESAEYDVDTISYTIPSVGAASQGEWAYLPNVGDTVASWIERLHEEFANKYVYGFAPTPTGYLFQFLAPSSLGTSTQKTVYLTAAAAVTDGYDPGDWTVWATDFEEQSIEPEANDIYVIGRNPRSGVPIIAHYRDTASADATLAIGSRPENWLGEIRQFGYVDPSLTTDADVLQALSTFAEVLPVKRKIAQWTCQMQFKEDGYPMWRGNVMEVKTKGRYRILSFSVLLDLEYADPGEDETKDRVVRNVRYIGERLGD